MPGGLILTRRERARRPNPSEASVFVAQDRPICSPL
jgi:hypothetical protein